MVRWPWERGETDETVADPRGGLDAEPLLVCDCQDGTLFVYDDHVFVARAGPSRFEDKAIPRGELTDVTVSKRGAIGYLQLQQEGVENDEGGFLSSPVDENTLHFGRGGRECAERAREELLFGDSGAEPTPR